MTVVATHDCGSHWRAHLPAELGGFPSSVTDLVTLGFYNFISAQLTIKPFSSFPLAPQPGPNRPFRRPSPLPLCNLQSFSPKCVLCVQSAHAVSGSHRCQLTAHRCQLTAHRRAHRFSHENSCLAEREAQCLFV